MERVIKAKESLDVLIAKSRIHWYKPIQIAEILYRDRVYKDITLTELDSYRTKSKMWRDNITIELLGRKCSSSARFQDNLFDSNAMPPEIIDELGRINRVTNGAVEAYIYKRFDDKHTQLRQALDYCLEASKENFDVKRFIDSFWNEPGLRRSLDKIYEIVVFSLFDSLVESLKLKIEISVAENQMGLLKEFQDFAHMVMSIDVDNLSNVQDARVYRVGVTNAADRGLDMYSNWGPAIQIKHLSLDEELAQNIVENISSDKIIIVCKDAERKVILSLLTQIGWKSHIQSIVTENDLIKWYEKALRGEYSEVVGGRLLTCMCEEIVEEFPLLDDVPDVLKNRKYFDMDDCFWK